MGLVEIGSHGIEKQSERARYFVVNQLYAAKPDRYTEKGRERKTDIVQQREKARA
jgi:hypothetical protein